MFEVWIHHEAWQALPRMADAADLEETLEFYAIRATYTGTRAGVKPAIDLDDRGGSARMALAKYRNKS